MKTTIIDGVAGATYATAASNTAALLFSSAKLDAKNGIQSALIECDIATGYGLRYAFGGTSPVLGTPSTMHYLAPGSTVEVIGYANLSSMRVINDVTGENAVIYITPKY